MDRPARILSLLVFSLGLGVAAFLGWTSRGIPVGRHVSPSNDSLPPARLHELNLRYGTAEAEGPSLDSFRLAVREHLTRLEESRAPVTTDDLTTVANQPHAYGALEILRPYWLDPILDARVRVGGQFLGPIADLQAVSVATVDAMRLEFSPVEPHWIVQVYLR